MARWPTITTLPNAKFACICVAVSTWQNMLKQRISDRHISMDTDPLHSSHATQPNIGTRTLDAGMPFGISLHFHFFFLLKHERSLSRALPYPFLPSECKRPFLCIAIQHPSSSRSALFHLWYGWLRHRLRTTARATLAPPRSGSLPQSTSRTASAHSAFLFGALLVLSVPSRDAAKPQSFPAVK